MEYTLVIKKLLGSPAPLTYRGEFYRVDRVKLAPVAPPELFPGIFIAESPETGANAAARLGAIAVKSPKVANEETGPSDKSVKFAIRIGVLARENADEAWKIAQTRLPEDRRGQSTQQAMTVSDSTSHQELGFPTPSVKKAPYMFFSPPYCRDAHWKRDSQSGQSGSNERADSCQAAFTCEPTPPKSGFSLAPSLR